MQPSTVYLDRKIVRILILKAPKNRESALLFWHLNAPISIEITLLGDGWLSSCSFKRAALSCSLNDFNACQEALHVCAVHNREQGILVLQEKVCSVISITIPAIFRDISASFYSCPCQTDILAELVVFMAGSNEPAASDAPRLLSFLLTQKPVVCLSLSLLPLSSLHSKPGPLHPALQAHYAISITEYSIRLRL